MQNDYCPFLNAPCRKDCVFIEYQRGLVSPVPVCALASRIKGSHSLDTKIIADALKTIITVKAPK